MLITYSGANLTPSTTSLCGAYSLVALALANCIGPTLAMVVGSPLVVLPTIVDVGYSHQCIDPCCYTRSRGLGSLPITTIGAVSYHLIVPNPSALTCQDFKELSNHVVLI